MRLWLILFEMLELEFEKKDETPQYSFPFLMWTQILHCDCVAKVLHDSL